MKSKNVTFNIVTRASRSNYFKQCYDSIHNQTYKKFKHFVTYEDDSMKHYLEQFDDLILVKVPSRRRIEGLVVAWNHNPSTDKYLNPNHELFNYRFLNSNETIEDNKYKNDSVGVENEGFPHPVRNGINKTFTPDKTWVQYSKHAPYNTYLKIVEGYLDDDAWILYVDDDDKLTNNFILNTLNKIIVGYGSEDVLHINTLTFPNSTNFPNEEHKFLYQHGFPFIHGNIGTMNMCFHSKYKQYTYWDEWTGGDYRTITSLREAIGNINITETNIIETQNGSSGGSRKDL
jgi:hypothetical protein